MMKCCALLRGINVGGNNLIKMADLKACFEAMGFGETRTYIASGNVIFESDEKDLETLSQTIERGLSKEFGYKACVVVVPYMILSKVVRKAPKGFGEEPERYRYDVIFLRAPMTAAEAIKSVEARDGVDEAWQGDDVLYFSRIIKKAAQSKLPKLASKPAYKSMTVRNWNTATKLFSLLSEPDR
ncbi:MAG: DUF1697 domain-containing protein [Candidatus Taylorbacteria bacterium]|nr:DUF1697 domain-containing protein [Candidatus Taylorbacteria bacterium]